MLQDAECAVSVVAAAQGKHDGGIFPLPCFNDIHGPYYALQGSIEQDI